MQQTGGKRWLLGHFAGGTPVPTNPQRQSLYNVLTVERQSVHPTGELTLVTMVGGENVYIDTMPETLIGAVAPAGPL